MSVSTLPRRYQPIRAPRPTGGNARHDPENVLAAIRRFTARNGYPPSIRDLGRECGISSTSVVSYQLANLEREGLVTWTPGLARSIRLTTVAANPADRLALLERVAVDARAYRDNFRRLASGGGGIELWWALCASLDALAEFDAAEAGPELAEAVG